jgi:lipoate-protein ligase B
VAPVESAARRSTHCSFLGRVSYAAATALQEELRDQLLRATGSEALLLLEHPPIFTVGRNAAAGDVTASLEWLDSRGVQVHRCDRGGQVTYHGPGQLVGYPIVDLSPDRRDIRRYVRDLQEVLVRTLADFEVAGEGGSAADGIGVWTSGRKVASIGVHLRRWVTTHGFALNVTTDLSFFAGIRPCGLQSDVMASIESLTGARVQLPEVARRCARHFAAVFDRDLVWDRSGVLSAEGK